MIIHLNPKGLLVMDTCCFVNYCNRNDEAKKKGDEVFNYKEIDKFLNETGYKLVVTPYTMYECIQNCVTPEVIARQREAFKRAGEFWVVNMNHLLGKDVSCQYGPDWVSEFYFDNQEMFLRKRNFWKWRLYSSQTPKIRLLIQMIAIIYVLITECNDNCDISPLTVLKRRFIDEQLARHRGVQGLLESFVLRSLGLGYTVKGGVIVKSKDAKDNLADFVEDMVKQMIGIANIQVGTAFPSVVEMNQAISKEHDRIRRDNLYEKETMRNRYLAVKKLSNDRFTLDKMIEGMLKEQSPLFREFYKTMVNGWFQKKSRGSKMANSFIDFVNLDVVEANRNIPLIYITEEDLFIEMMDKVNSECLNDTKKCYKDYYIG